MTTSARHCAVGFLAAMAVSVLAGCSPTESDEGVSPPPTADLTDEPTTEPTPKPTTEPTPEPTTEPTTDLAGPAGPERIAFTRWDNPEQGHPELWTGNIDGADLQRVGDQHGYFPDWSPDRTHLLFDFVDENGYGQIATIRPDGTGFTQLTDSTYNEAADYSPDGSTIVFDGADLTQSQPDFTTTLMLMDADGGNVRPLLDPADGGFDYEPEYSPDGLQITFVRYDLAADTTAVYLAGADGTNVRQLSPSLVYVEHPRWSPDGSTVIYNVEYLQDLDDPRNGIWTIPAAGGTPTALLPTYELLHGFKPDYSPDGSRILFGCLTRQDRREDLCVMNADGTGVEQLTRTATFENHPVWD